MTYVEGQEELLCGKHALNMVLGEEVFVYGKPADAIRKDQHSLESLCDEEWALKIKGCNMKNQNFSDDFLEALVTRVLKLRGKPNSALAVSEERDAGYRELLADIADPTYVGTLVCLAGSAENRQKTWHWIALTPFATECGEDQIAYIDPMELSAIECLQVDVKSVKNKLESVFAAAFLSVFDQVGGQETANVKRVRDRQLDRQPTAPPTSSVRTPSTPSQALITNGSFRVIRNGIPIDMKNSEMVDADQLISLTGPAVLQVLGKPTAVDVVKKIAVVPVGFVPTPDYVQQFPAQALLLAYTYAVLDKNHGDSKVPALDADLVEKYVWVLEHPEEEVFETLRAHVGLPDSFTLEDLKDPKKVLGFQKAVEKKKVTEVKQEKKEEKEEKGEAKKTEESQTPPPSNGTKKQTLKNRLARGFTKGATKLIPSVNYPIQTKGNFFGFGNNSSTASIEPRTPSTLKRLTRKIKNTLDIPFKKAMDTIQAFELESSPYTSVGEPTEDEKIKKIKETFPNYPNVPEGIDVSMLPYAAQADIIKEKTQPAKDSVEKDIHSLKEIVGKINSFQGSPDKKTQLQKALIRKLETFMASAQDIRKSDILNHLHKEQLIATIGELIQTIKP